MGTYNADEYPATSKIRSIAYEYGFAPQDDLKVDQFSTADTKKVYSIVRKIGSTRLHFLVDPSLVPG